MAVNLQIGTHAPQSVHFAMSMTAFLFAMCMAPNGQALTQSVHPTHLLRSICIELAMLDNYIL
jgi:hypothetical protein